MIGVIGIVISLLLLMYLAYRGVSVILLAPVLAMLAVIFAQQGTEMLAIYTQIFMQKMGGFIVKYFPIFLLGAVFGKLMEDSGCARSIARSIINTLGKNNAALSIVLACGLLTYGGVSAFVVAFTVYPLGAAIFKEINLPKRYIPATIALGAFTFTMTCLPGTMQIHNIIPTRYFATDAYAAPLVGLLAGLLMMILGLLWINMRLKKSIHEGYGQHHTNEPSLSDTHNLPSIWSAYMPIVVVVVVNLVATRYWIPEWDTAYLDQEKYGATSVNTLTGIWSMIIALISAIAVLFIVNFRRFKNINNSMTQGALGSMLPTFNTGSEVGYGGTIASLGAFVLVRDAVVNISPGNPLISEVIAVNVLAGITGSASGGLTIALETLGDTYAQLAEQYAINPEWMHRLASMASGGFDSLPHNGAVITLLTICGLSHKQSYKDIAMVSLVIPFTITCLFAFVLSWLV